MPKTCTKCGNPINEGEKFCTSCGTPVEVVRVTANRFCRQCGNLLSPGAKFCDVCGKEAPQEKKKEEPKIEEPATMEGLVSPVITEETFASARELNHEKFDGFEAAEMPGSAPRSVQTPSPAPSFEMDAAAVNQPKATHAPQQPKPAPQPRPQVTAQSIQQSNPYAQYGARQTTGNPMQNQMSAQAQAAAANAVQNAQNFSRSQPQPVIDAQQMQQSQAQAQYQQQSAPMPQSMPQPEQNAGEKKQSNAAPIIIAILIVVVIVVDILLFAGPLGDKIKEKNKNEKDVSIIQLLDGEETDENINI